MGKGNHLGLGNTWYRHRPGDASLLRLVSQPYHPEVIWHRALIIKVRERLEVTAKGRQEGNHTPLKDLESTHSRPKASISATIGCLRTKASKIRTGSSNS